MAIQECSKVLLQIILVCLFTMVPIAHDIKNIGASENPASLDASLWHHMLGHVPCAKLRTIQSLSHLKYHMCSGQTQSITLQCE